MGLSCGWVFFMSIHLRVRLSFSQNEGTFNRSHLCGFFGVWKYSCASTETCLLRAPVDPSLVSGCLFLPTS